MRVLFVDDDKGVSQSVETALRRKGYDVDTADLGADALALIEDTSYDLVVLDVGLPDMDGYHIVRRMKIDEIDTPVIMQTGLVGQDLTEDAQTLGVQGVLAKPFSIHELLECMNSVFTPAGEDGQEPGAATGPTVPAPTAPQPAQQSAAAPEPGRQGVARPIPRSDPAPPPQADPASGRALRRALMSDDGPAADGGPKAQPSPSPVAAPGPRPARGPDPEPIAEVAEEPSREAVPADDGDERRGAERAPTVEAALITEDGEIMACVILDLSQGGAQVMLAEPNLSCPKRFTLKPLDGLERCCEVRWRNGANIGVKFI